jgi:hypothetical protein
MVYLNFALSIAFNGIAFSIFGVLVERLLIRYGLVRGDTIGVIVGCFFIALVRQLVDGEQAYWWLYWFVASILAPISLNRIDLISTMTKGRWWWKESDESKKRID